MCNSIFCVLPPHILHSMIALGDEHHRAYALHTLAHTERMRGHREILRKYDIATTGNKGLERVIQNANDTQNFLGPTVRQEGQSLTGDQAVDEAYAYLGATYDLYKQAYGRNSIDNNGMTLFATVHYGKHFDNAFWNGERMVFGDGDGKIFNLFTKCPEVIGHELTHGVTEFSSNLIYQGQPGALNEGISDVFGSLVKQHLDNQTADQANWIIGDGLFTSSVNGIGVRDLKNPGQAYNDPVLGKDPCPANMANFVHTSQDNGGIHINCTIPGHAFYVSAIERGGYAWKTVGKAWYAAVTRRLQKNTNFQQFATMTIQTSIKIFGKGSLETKAIHKGWKAVGVF